jgi:hypothetical protein
MHWYRRQNTSADVPIHQRSGLCRINLDLQHWVVGLQTENWRSAAIDWLKRLQEFQTPSEAEQCTDALKYRMAGISEQPGPR